MVNELCELAASGMSAIQLLLLGITIVGVSSTLLILHKKGVRVRWMLPVFLLALSLTTPLQQGVFAQSAGNCQQTQPSGQSDIQPDGSGNPSEPEAIGGLVDDNPALEYDEDFGEFFAAFTILNNDNAPEGDPFDVSTLQLVSDYSLTDAEGEAFLILDPDNQTMPDPDGDWWDAPNVWGYWYLELTCDPDDTDYCATDLEDNIFCTSPLSGSCWPNGTVKIYINGSTPTGAYNIQYTVKTQSGAPLLPATITVTVPGPPEPSPITATDTGEIYMKAGQNCADNPFDENWSVDLKNFVTTTGTGTLLWSTVDLNLLTPGIQNTVTELGTTFTVDSNGIVTMTSPSGPGAHPDGGFSYTVQDSDGFTSNSAVGLSIVLGGDCT